MTPMELGDYWDRGYIIDKPKKNVYSFERYEGTEPDVVIPDCVSIIRKNAFAKNQYLQSVVIPEGITEIPDKAFYGCTALRRVVLPSTLKVIGDSAFTGCRLLESITFPQGLCYIGCDAFCGCGFRKLVIPDSVGTISAGAFRCCDSLTDVSLPAGVRVARSYKEEIMYQHPMSGGPYPVEIPHNGAFLDTPFGRAHGME